MKILIVFCLWFTCIIFPATGQQASVLKFQNGSVCLTGSGATSVAEEQWTTILRVYTQEALDKHLNQPVSGTYIRHGDSLLFTPDFSFVPGVNYHAVSGKLELAFSIPKEKIAQTFIEAVHPQANKLPENMLRMYISFSASMMPGEAYEHITLLTEKGTPVEKAFLIIDQELWDTDRKRFTLLFDPGRVKRGIQSNVELGAPLRAGQTYRLIIDSTWRDADGNFLTNGYTKTFTVTGAERTKLSIDQWKIVAPATGTLTDLLIEFDRPVDYALALNCITITGTKGKVNGKATLVASNQWRFTPWKPWSEGQYYVEVYPHMEDVAGNNFNNVFDIDLSKESRVNSSSPVKQPFLIRSMVVQNK